MFVDSLGTVFLHVPKTGGNFVQTVFMDLGLTKDQKVVSGHQDGANRFEIRGPETKSKHQTLEEYRRYLVHQEFRELQVLVTYRPPVERVVSLYLSPHRWISEPIWSRLSWGIGSWTCRAMGMGRDQSRLVAEMQARRAFRDSSPDAYDIDDFAIFCSGVMSTRQMTRLQGGPRPRSFRWLRFERLTQDLHAFLTETGVCVAKLPRGINEGTNKRLFDEMIGDGKIQDIVRSSHHVQDLTLLPDASA